MRELELIIKAQNGCDVSIKTLINLHKGYINTLINKYTRGLEPHLQADPYYAQYYQAGQIGIFKALKKYDANKGNKFLTYASWWIMKEVRAEISKVLSEIKNHNSVESVDDMLDNNIEIMSQGRSLEDDIILGELRTNLDKLMSGLSKTERDILEFKYCDKKTESKIAVELGMDLVKVSNTKDRGLHKLRKLVFGTAYTRHK